MCSDTNTDKSIKADAICHGNYQDGSCFSSALSELCINGNPGTVGAFLKQREGGEGRVEPVCSRIRILLLLYLLGEDEREAEREGEDCHEFSLNCLVCLAALLSAVPRMAAAAGL